MITDPLFYALAVPAVIIYGISKGGFGGGFGIIAVPLMAMAVPATLAAAIMLPILCIMDLVGLRVYWGKWDSALLRIMVPPALVGIAVGALSFHYLEDDHIRLILGAVAVVFSLAHWVRPRTDGPRLPAIGKGVFWSTISGFTSFVSHAGGPPVTMFLLPLGIDKTRYQATMIGFFTAVNYAKLLPYGLVGQFHAVSVSTAAVMLPMALLGMFLGIYLHKKVSQTLFVRICYVLLFLTGLKLIWDGIG